MSHAQMLESRDMTNVPVIVAANKMDRVTTADAVAIRERKDIVHLVNFVDPTEFLPAVRRSTCGSFF